MRWVLSVPLGFVVADLYRLTPVLVSLRDFAVRLLELRSVFHTFLCDVPHVFMAIILSV